MHRPGQTAYEPGQFKTRLADLDIKFDTLREKEQALASQLAYPAESFDPQALATVAERFGQFEAPEHCSWSGKTSRQASAKRSLASKPNSPKLRTRLEPQES